MSPRRAPPREGKWSRMEREATAVEWYASVLKEGMCNSPQEADSEGSSQEAEGTADEYNAGEHADGTSWTKEEQAIVFPLLSRIAPPDPSTISLHLQARSAPDTAAYLSALDEGAKHLPEDWRRGEVPRAREVGEEWPVWEQWAAAKLQDLDEEMLRRKRDESELELVGLATRHAEGNMQPAGNISHFRQRPATRKRPHCPPNDTLQSDDDDQRTAKRRRLLAEMTYPPAGLRALHALLNRHADSRAAPEHPQLGEDQLPSAAYLDSLSREERQRLLARFRQRRRQAAKKGVEPDLTIPTVKKGPRGPRERIVLEDEDENADRKRPRTRGLHDWAKWMERVERWGVEADLVKDLDLLRPKGFSELMALYYNALWPSKPLPDPHIQHSLLILLSSQLRHWLIQTVHRIIVLAEQHITLRRRTLVFKDREWDLAQWIKPEDVREVVMMAGDRPDTYCWWADVGKRLGVTVDEENVPFTGRQTKRGMRHISSNTNANPPPPFLPVALTPEPPPHEDVTYLRTPSPSLVSEELHSEESLDGSDIASDPETEQYLWDAIGGKTVWKRLWRRRTKQGRRSLAMSQRKGGAKSKEWIEDNDEAESDVDEVAL
ncbi:hypothetical protein DACRYDRAFT_13800 [Dacryopinax primogenitus]|uniref:Uncharacterized protein n=1 Tax=Dacryopinax primogenitus (strain DJM 731) TaxID=1858805 RepID=M5GFY5_DACPD|nr:uncharacterized protein DACRYDRAFT_13800 [Dacryopinax primogenitus]EJU04558.1 hypothetical protein DACRYDRAFT_13800 [Dacryopinax primogenitus]